MKIVWSRRAIANLIALRDYIAQNNPRAAAAVAARILETVHLLALYPHIGRPGRVTGTRELVVSGTPYIVPYRVRPNRVEVVAIFHGRQRWPESG